MFNVLDMLLGTGAGTGDLSQSSIQISITLRQDLTTHCFCNRRDSMLHLIV